MATSCLRLSNSLARPLIQASRQSGRSIRRYSSKPDAPSTLPRPRLDLRDIVENVVYKSHNAFNRRVQLPLGSLQHIEHLSAERKSLLNDLIARRHTQSLVGDRIRQSARDPDAKKIALQEAKSLKTAVLDLEKKLAQVEDRLYTLALAVPNDTHPSAPIGAESQAVTLSTHGPPPLPSSPERDHVSVARALDLIDLEAGALVTGSSWYYLRNEAALLEMALVNYALSIAISHGFTPVTTPDVVRSDIATRCGFQPRDQADPPVAQMYHIAGTGGSQPELVLTGTAEIPLAGLFANKIIPAQSLPSKVVGLGRAFRAEAGARGADTRGLYRVHQFTKLELFAVCEPGQSEELMEGMKQLQIKIFEGLGFPFRVLDMPTEELGASAYRKFDIEAWMPGRGSWGEISSTSNCTNYQARRLHIRYRPTPPSSAEPTSESHHGSLPFAHTLNGTAVAVPRLIVALLENGVQFKDGNVVGLDLPSALKPHWLGSPRDIVRWV